MSTNTKTLGALGVCSLRVEWSLVHIPETLALCLQPEAAVRAQRRWALALHREEIRPEDCNETLRSRGAEHSLKTKALPREKRAATCSAGSGREGTEGSVSLVHRKTCGTFQPHFEK